MLDKILAFIADILANPRVVEQGTSGVWRWRKWSDGTAECWCKGGLLTLPINTVYGGGYYGGLSTVNFPSSLFIEAPIAQVTLIGGDGVYAGVSTVDNTKLTYYPFCTKSGSHGWGANVSAVGRWK